MNFLKGVFSKRPQGIGVELTPERVNIVRLAKKGQGFKLVSLHSAEVPEGVFQDGQILDAPAMAEIIQSILNENKIKVKNAATAVSGREAVTRLIPVPAELDDAELREMVLNQEAGLYLPFPREEADVDYQKLDLIIDDDGIEKVRVLLVATRKEVTNNYINTFQQAGLHLDILEISSFSLIRTIREQLRQFAPQEAVAIANIEFEGTEIAIAVDGVPQFSRTVPIGTYQIQTALSQAMNLPPTRNTDLLQGMTIPTTPVDSVRTGMTGINPGAAAMVRVLGELADELRRSIDFYVNQGENQEVAQLLLAGSGGGIGQLDEFFTQRLSVPTSQVDPIEALSLEVEQEIPPMQRPGLGIALGLGLRYVN
ncbi:type IV pilus assembly protein PilM [Desertifilum sp. FACHB-1129]|uniref:Pilus assembly protein PilM n=1 Tax=Desertifilum tharense IPPAS B-1220 TaxID=1781255 RepID=A0A1E5QJZ5_9CYAN|nr:type IV pilus assembly protein PilM [Desertifilum tharense]MBD2313551.1 type IV pilus assembly protein PilM [Desertifilum sp. FACHB-1129]MBD2323883.1 type IV pilus assembly protein PilM [Desertifilum sp. FACHB-866]MBD2333728.1 type IV pilus assembly protein PilM [Desertifilum sp. FACHB-868]MCD8488575.1 type IV pilus assembly protein PilM [Desertifilum sp.]MDA0211404.1 type IV pilus assembly protein PilM [Cyanobacteria bacterium FC1]MDI9637844.1 type IV pilus assembly protein PilM [Geitleri